MSSRASRREFFRNCGVVAGGAAGLLSGASAPTARAIEPIARNGKSFFKFSMAAYSYRDLLNAKPPKMPLKLEDFINDCAKLGLQGTELTSYYFPQDLTQEYLRHIRRHCFLQGLDVSGTAVGNDFCFPPGADRDREIKHVKQWVDNAAILGAPVIRIFSGHPHDTSAEEAHKLAVAGMEECCQYAGEHGVFLALENHGGLTATADGLLALVRDVKSPWFGVNLDTGNFHGEDLYGEIAKLAPYAVNVQIKASVSGPDRKRQHGDFRRLARIMTDAGYRGYIVLEFEEPEDPLTACPRYVDEMRQAFSS